MDTVGIKKAVNASTGGIVNGGKAWQTLRMERDIDGPLDKPINVKLNEAFVLPVRALCRRDRVKPTEVVNAAVREYLERKRYYPTARIAELLREAVEVAESQKE